MGRGTLEPRSKRDSKGGLTTAEEEGNAAGGCPPQVDVYEKGSATRIHIELRKFLICQTAVACSPAAVGLCGPVPALFLGRRGEGGRQEEAFRSWGPAVKGGGRGKGCFFAPQTSDDPLLWTLFPEGGREGGSTKWGKIRQSY